MMASDVSDSAFKYKELIFELKPNRLGVSKDIYPLICKMNKLEYEATKHLLIDSNYQKWFTLAREYNIYNEDTEKQKAKLEENPDDENAKKAIEENKPKIDKVKVQLQSPELTAICELKQSEELEMRIMFIYSPDKIKDIVSDTFTDKKFWATISDPLYVIRLMINGLLKGETDKIEYDGSEEFWEFADKVIAVFFYIKNLTKLNAMK